MHRPQAADCADELEAARSEIAFARVSKDCTSMKALRYHEAMSSDEWHNLP